LILRIDTSDNPTADELLQRIRQKRDEGLAHSNISFSKLVQELCPNPDSCYQPICQVAFSVEMKSEVDERDAKFDLHFQVGREDETALRIKYAEDLFEAQTIQRLLAQWETVLRDILEHPSRRLSELSILPREEERLLLVEWNNTQKEYPREK